MSVRELSVFSIASRNSLCDIAPGWLMSRHKHQTHFAEARARGAGGRFVRRAGSHDDTNQPSCGGLTFRAPRVYNDSVLEFLVTAYAPGTMTKRRYVMPVTSLY